MCTHRVLRADDACLHCHPVSMYACSTRKMTMPGPGEGRPWSSVLQRCLILVDKGEHTIPTYCWPVSLRTTPLPDAVEQLRESIAGCESRIPTYLLERHELASHPPPLRRSSNVYAPMLQRSPTAPSSHAVPWLGEHVATRYSSTMLRRSFIPVSPTPHAHAGRASR